MGRISAASVVVVLVTIQMGMAEDDADTLRRFDFSRIEMGVEFVISLYACDSEVANNAAEAAYQRIAELNLVYSDYTSTSELRRLCARSGPGIPVAVSPDLEVVLHHSLKLSRESGGAFDITVGPLTKLWRRARRQERLPDPDNLSAARSLVGYRFIQLDDECGKVELQKKGMRLDLGGIAKGRAADEALAVIQNRGIMRALVDGSGDVVAGDPPPGKEGWVIDVAALDPDGRQSAARIQLANAAVATSGDAFQSVEIDGRRYSHILDPQTGLGLSRRSSVTVIAPTGMEADSLASAISVLGSEEGLEIVGGRGHGPYAALLVIADDMDQPQLTRSRCFATYETPAAGAPGKVPDVPRNR